MSALREYQTEAIRGVFAAWRDAGEPGRTQNELGGDMSAVVLVSPTGSGKTRMGADIVRRAVKVGKRVLWVAHRKELISQAADTLSMAIGQKVSTDLDALFAQVFVASIQTLLANNKRPDVDLLVIDECHHIVADEWKTITDDYDHVRILGLTATPTRQDEIPLGVTFGGMVNAVHYSRLLSEGHLVDAMVFAPKRKLDKGIALEPLVAYQQYVPGRCGFVFVRTKAEAKELAEEFNAAGVPAAEVTDSTPKKERARRIKALADGELKVLVNVYTLTEGVDVPCAEFVMLARNCGHISMYLQIVGRALRPYPGKTVAYVVDLVGSMREHGFPTEDRHWNIMHGKASKGEVARYGMECPECMAYFMRASKCPNCGHDLTVPVPGEEPEDQRVYNIKLQCVVSAAQNRRISSSPAVKRKHFFRLVDEWSNLTHVVREYRREYEENPDPEWFDSYMKIGELKRMVSYAESRQQHAYAVQKRYKDVFGEKPNFKLVDCEKLKKNTVESMKKKRGGKLTRQDRAVYLQIFGPGK